MSLSIPKIELTSGQTSGIENIIEQFDITSAVVHNNLMTWMREYITQFYPRLTGRLCDEVIDSLIIDIKGIIMKSSHVTDEREKRYAKYVEAMSGVNWTNPLTIEQPAESLRDATTRILKEFWIKFSTALGLDIK